jgi:hypothetical protein
MNRIAMPSPLGTNHEGLWLGEAFFRGPMRGFALDAALKKRMGRDGIEPVAEEDAAEVARMKAKEGSLGKLSIGEDEPDPYAAVKDFLLSKGLSQDECDEVCEMHRRLVSGGEAISLPGDKLPVGNAFEGGMGGRTAPGNAIGQDAKAFGLDRFDSTPGSRDGLGLSVGEWDHEYARERARRAASPASGSIEAEMERMFPGMGRIGIG